MNTEELNKVFDLCIVGSGPAGVILALEYRAQHPGATVVMVEYGLKNQGAKNNLDDTIEVLNPVNHHDPYECTNKGFGGSSATWGGRCVLYDPVDFIPRPVVGDGCTWSIELFHELQQYLPAAANYFECGGAVFETTALPKLASTRMAEGFQSGVVTDTKVERWSMPTRFGKRYANDIRNNPQYTLLEGYEAREFGPVDENGKIGFLTVREQGSGQKQNVRAKAFALAAGTQETTRILLRNKQVFSNLGFVPDALGKYYQSHLSGKIASVHFRGNPRKTDYGFLRDEDGSYLRRRFQFSDAFLVENNLLNTAIWLDNALYYDPKHKSGAMSFMYLAMLMPVISKKLAPPAIAYSITKGKVYKVHQHLWNILKQFPSSLVTPASIFYRRYCLKRKLPGIFLYNKKNTYALHFHSEQIPVAENRMELGSDGETLMIHYNLVEEDVQSVIRLHDVLDQWLQKTGVGELQYWFDKNDLPAAIKKMSKDGIHQSGTTRIADSPETGVVDQNLKVWGTDNLYVCSSSAFPTSGQANPTFMIGAFAVRLAKHLALQQTCEKLNLVRESLPQ